MKRFTKILLAIMACLIPMTNLSTTSAQAATTTEQTALKAFLHKKLPTATDSQLDALINNPDFVEAAGRVTQLTVTPLSTPKRIITPTTFATTAASHYDCWYAWSKVKGRGIFGTLFSFKVQLDWCDDGYRVYKSSYKSTPDVTTYGGTLGWAYAGKYDSDIARYYGYNGHTNGAYIIEMFGQFDRCLTKLGCISQAFADVGVKARYDHTTSYIHDLN